MIDCDIFGSSLVRRAPISGASIYAASHPSCLLGHVLRGPAGSGRTERPLDEAEEASFGPLPAVAFRDELLLHS